MAGRRSGGESPELEAGGETVYRDAPRARDEEIASDEEDLSHLPIANKYIAERRMSGSWASRPSSRVAGSLGGGSVGRGTYHAVGDTEAAEEAAEVTTVSAPVAAVAAGAAIAATAASAHQAGEGSGSSASHAHTHSSRGLFHASGSNGDDHHRPGSPTSGGSHENAEVVTAQRATRSPLARLARLSWFARNRNEPGTSLAAAGLVTDSDDEGSWVNVRSSAQQMGERGGAPLTTPLLSQPPSGGGRIPIITRQAASRSNTALVDTSQQSPPPAAYFNVARSRSTRRQSGQSARSAQSGQTVFFDAEEEPAPPPATARMPPASGSTLTPPVTAGVAQPQRYSIPQSGSESSRGEGPSAADFPIPPPALSPSLSYQWPQFRNSDSQNNDSPSLSATTESPIPPGQPIAGLFTRSLSGVGVIGAPITTSQGDTLEPPVEERRRHVSEPNLREQALAAEGGGHHTRLSTLEESLDDSWRRRAVSPVTASAAAVISGASIYGDERSRRMTLGPTSFVDTPQVVDQSEVASLRGDVHSSYTGNGTQSNRDASYPSRNGQGGTMATHTTFSTGGAQRRLAATPNRPPSLSAIGGRPWSITSDTAAGTTSDSGTGTGTGSGTGGSSSQQSPQSVRVSRLTEMGEIRPPQRAAVPPSLAIVGERMRPSIDTPPPPPSAGPHSEGLTPPPPRPWWRPYP
ncbi:hypothetical protein FRC04_006957 [Tulasnella sp. 424]|nr:hypothetical protein FRC04_006957 [Tulasnella sp. 424]